MEWRIWKDIFPDGHHTYVTLEKDTNTTVNNFSPILL